MLPAAARMRRRAEFSCALRGRRAATRTLTVHWAGAERVCARAGCDPVRVGFAVGRPVGNAVVRNQVRRRLRELVRARYADLPAVGCLLIRANAAAADADTGTLARDLTIGLDRALAGAR
jgi:ribonuclease P protein component